MTADNQSAATPTAARENGLARGAILRVVLLYAVLAAVWMLLSDQLVVRFFHDPASVSLASALKGSLFVGVTSLLCTSCCGVTPVDWPPESPDEQAEFGPRPTKRGVPELPDPAGRPAGRHHRRRPDRRRRRLYLRHRKEDGSGAAAGRRRPQGPAIAHWLNERESDARFVQTSRYWFGLYRRWRRGR